MRIIIVSLNQKFNYLRPKIRKIIAEVSRILKVRDAYVEVFLVNSGFMKKNVLAFPAPDGFPHPEIKSKVLGEIYINPSYIKKNKENFSYMVIHGFLHLLGYDHKKKNDRIKMEKKEVKLLSML